MPKPVCVGCQCFYRPHKNGYAFIEGMPMEKANNEEIRGKRRPEAWGPYKLWNGDLWKCPDCDHLLIVGAGFRPLAEHYQAHFDEVVAAYGGQQLQVNDC